MNKHSKKAPRNSSSDAALGSPSPLSVLLVCSGLVAYAAIFLGTALPSLSHDDAITRAGYLQSAVLLFDELIANWCGDPPGFGLFDRIPVLLIALAIVSFGTLLGWSLLRLAGMLYLFTRLERWVFATGVGMSALSLCVLASGLIGWLGPLSVWIVPTALIVCASTGAMFQERWNPIKTDENGVLANSKPIVTFAAASDSADWMSPHWLWGLLPIALLIVLGGLLPPAEFDVREYHLQVPKEFWQQGRITFVPHNVYGNMPLGAEMFSLLGMAAAGDWWTGALVGKTIIALFAPLTAVALVAVGQRLLTRTAGIAAALVYISTTWVAQVSSLGLIDGVVGCYSLLAIYATLVGAMPQYSRRWLILAGFMAGSTVACKYTGLLFVIPPLVAWVWWRCGWRDLLLFAVAAFIGCGPWLIKNAVLAGNPFFPLLANWFGGIGRTPELDAQWRAVHLPHDHGLSSLLAALSQIFWRSEWLSILIVPFALLGLTARSQHKISLPLAAWIAWVFACWWAATHRIDRFLVPALPAAALLSGIGFCWSDSRAWRRICTVALILGLTIGWLFIAGPPGGYPLYFVSYQQLRITPNRVSPIQVQVNKIVPNGAAVLAVGEAQVFDIEPHVYYSTVFNECLLESWLKGRTPHEFQEVLASRGISHVLVNWSEIGRYRSPGNYGFTDFVTPELFDKLVVAGVLTREPKIPETSGEIFRVVELE